MNTDQNIGVATTRKTFAILEVLKEEEGLTITEITQRTDLTKSTIYRHLKTLSEMGYVIERDDGFYIGLRLLEIGEKTRNREAGYTIAKRKVFELGQETDERALFFVEEDLDGVYLHRYGSLSETMIGKRRPLHSLASGKVILAAWDDDKVDQYIAEKGLTEYTSNTTTDPDSLYEELNHIREQGYAVNNEEYMDGLCGVSVPVYTPENELLGALGVFGPTSRFKDKYMRNELVDRLWDKAGEVKVTIAYG
ncbi:IclR family transcriptional regulator [Natronorubrum thiooxidans]|uniref:Transcriptional regulator, IclR family n=1 Tax=Natronorubrum thiooxidans TaxID=308853 RepID=A0A1N7GL48_9EURY|nr:IclR family transcriptional regulator [Natronorubrum thiooxidans]SIS13236.1 transcriptional regulator, IclR family [Natronorubrum thiooxidans]